MTGTHIRAAMAAAVVGGLSGCGGTSPPSPTIPTFSFPARPSAAPTTRPTTAPMPPPPLALGGIAYVVGGATIAVETYADPAGVASWRTPKDPALHFVAVKVYECAGTKPDQTGALNFHVKMTDSTVVDSDAIGGADPAFPVSTTLQPTDCVRGWVTFETPIGGKPATVALDGSEQRWSLNGV